PTWSASRWMRRPDAPVSPAPPAALLAIPGVLGVGFGVKERAGALTLVPAWRVYVREKRPRRRLSPAERIPARIAGFATDVVERAETRATAGASVSPPQSPSPSPAVEGVRIANARGVPGTLGCVAVTLHDGAAVLLSNHHVLFGAGAGEDEAVWLVEGDGEPPAFRRIATSRYGKMGTVDCGGADHHVDCAVAALEGDALPPGWRAEPVETGEATASPGAAVTKLGGATGTTRGVIVDVAYPDVALVEGRTRAAPRQILVRPVDEGRAFSADGDSGAVLRDGDGAPVGLLWGVNHRGESVACHLAPVLQVLGIRPARLVPPPVPAPRPRRGPLARLAHLFGQG
ncbi:MAG TPA: hypothetical protein VF771_12395, partial [Longimicrobiaceae bacterium]